jgi:malate dehydrogenase (oxaloacetate-decarboxylating)(NADP+)
LLNQDFSTDNAFKYLDRFRNKYAVFNDDIQGTGAVILSGFLNAAKIASAASGRPLTSHRILFFGAGSAGVGVAMQLQSFFTLQGRSIEEARRQIYLVDLEGLVYNARGRLPEYKKCMLLFSLFPSWMYSSSKPDFSRDDYSGPPMTNLLDIIDYAKPTALFGLSTVTVNLESSFGPYHDSDILISGCIYTRGYSSHGR